MQAAPVAAATDGTIRQHRHVAKFARAAGVKAAPGTVDAALWSATWTAR